MPSSELSAGFVKYACQSAPVFSKTQQQQQHMATLASQQGLLWESPTLQVLDIQKFTPPPPLPDNNDDSVEGDDIIHRAPPNPKRRSRFYLVLSDSQDCVWAIAPPGSPLEEAIKDFDVEVGTCVSLGAYTVVNPRGAGGPGSRSDRGAEPTSTAAPDTSNSTKPLLVVLSVATGLKLSCVGDPEINTSMFKLSHHAITPESFKKKDGTAAANGLEIGGTQMLDSEAAATAFMENAEILPLKSLFTISDEQYPSHWGVTVVVVWKSPRPRKNRSGGGEGGVGGANDAASRGRRYTFECRIMDEEGMTTHAVFWSPDTKLFDKILVHHVYSLGNIFLRYEEGSNPPRPVAVQITDRSAIVLLPDQDAARGSFPARPTRNLGGLDFNFDSVWEASSKEIGSLVNVKGIIIMKGTVSSVSTRFQSTVAKLNLTLQDHKDPAVAVELTLWGPHAAEFDQEAFMGEMWCFRDMKLGMYRNSRTLGSSGKTEFFLAPYEAQPQQQRTTTTTGGDQQVFGVSVNAVQAPNQSEAGGAQQVAGGSLQGGAVASRILGKKFLLSLEESTPQGPFCLCRIYSIRLPLFYMACGTCGKKTKSDGICSTCSASAPPGSYQPTGELRFLIRMELSDGINQLKATGFTTTGERLFEMSTQEFIQCQSVDPTYSKTVVQCLIGVPVLVKLSKGHEGDAHIVDIMHVDLDELVGDLAEMVNELSGA